MNLDKIRNFAIIAHIDHGKSTLADRLMEITGLVEKGRHDEQLLDRNPISRERGITIKLAPVTMRYGEYTLNLVDTPGHVDFSYEVERTLSSVEGVILLVDATQGIQAQTIAHAYKAIEQNLTIIPVVNKIDRPEAQVDKTVRELAAFLGTTENEVMRISARTGEGVPQLLQAVIEKIQDPRSKIQNNGPEETRALIFDSYFDPHQGVIAFVRVFAGRLAKGIKYTLLANGTEFEAQGVGIFTPDLVPADSLESGQIGYVVTNLKKIRLVRVGDTMADSPAARPLEGYKKVKAMVHASIFTTDADDYPNLAKALEKLYLNDAAIEFEPIYSKTLGPGFRVGFLGLLHADVTRERLEREFGQSLVLTPSQVDFHEEKGQFFEPISLTTIITPTAYMGAVMQLAQKARSTMVSSDNVALGNQMILSYELPIAELMKNFYDELKSVSSGYASLDWELLEYRAVAADRLEILINGEPVEEFSEIVVTENALPRSRELVERLAESIPRQMYEVRIQARFKGKIIASESVRPFRKDVTAKLYGGDRSRKDKLLKKQKKGKKLMKQVGRVEIPKEAFIKLFRMK